jgi:hypothetical protein
VSEPQAPSPATAAAAVPPWFRAVVWDSLLGGLCPLLPLPIVDDLALSKMRRRLVARLAQRWGLAPTKPQIRLLAGGPRASSIGRFVRKALVYPFKETLQKVLYFLAVNDAVGTFSLLFHQGYLLHAAASRGALGRGPALDDTRVTAVATAIHDVLATTDTRPLRRVLLGVLRNSRRLVRATVRFIGKSLSRGSSSELPEVSDSPARASGVNAGHGSPEAEQLLDRVLLVLWGERGHLEQLEARLVEQLGSIPMDGRST